jgi:hypothetical protein
VHPLPLARGLALDDRDEDALREEDPGAQVGDRNAHAHRTLARNAGDGHEAAHPLGDLIDAGPVPIRPVLPEAGDAAVDQARIDRAQALVVDAESALHVGAVVLHDDVGVLRQPLEDGHPVGLAEVQRDALLVAVQVLEIEPVTIAAHTVAGAAAGHLDLDRRGAPIDELPHAGRAGPRPGQVEHREPAEGKRRGAHDLASCGRRSFQGVASS